MGTHPGTRGVIQRRLADGALAPAPPSPPPPTLPIVVPAPPVPRVGDESARALYERQRRWIRAASVREPTEGSAPPPPNPAPPDDSGEGAKG
ncbi:MAG: hypothetical protein ACYCPN_06820 [Thermoplasmata archaeon]